jgi:hypothetical protein
MSRRLLAQKQTVVSVPVDQQQISCKQLPSEIFGSKFITTVTLFYVFFIFFLTLSYFISLVVYKKNLSINSTVL